MGLFCRDTRFLGRLELQIDGRSPVLLGSTARQGFALSVPRANPHIDGIPAETIGIQREIVLNGGLFEEIQLTNYNRHPVNLSASISFSADFMDLFEVRGFYRQGRGQLFRSLPSETEETEGMILAYRGLDGAVMESRVRFDPNQRPPELFCGYERVNGSSPVRYPVACSPQAWATGALFQLLQMMVNLVPDAPGNHLRIIEPAPIDSIDRLSIHDLRVGQTVLDLEFERSGTTIACRQTQKRGNLRVVIEV